MPILTLIIAIVMLAVCRQIYRITDTQTHRATINAVIISAMLMIVVGLFDSSTATFAQDDTSTDLIPIIESAVIQQTSVSESINATGSIVPNREVSLAFQYSARVTEVLVDVGDRVEEGQLLARVNSEDIEEIFQDAVFNAQNEQISFDELVGQPRDVDLAAAEASLKAAQLNFGGSSVLSGAGSTQAEIQRMQLELAQNRAWQLAMSRDNTIRGFQSAGAELESYDPLGNVIDAGFFSINLGGPELEDLQDQYDGALSQYYLALNSLNAAEANTAYAEAQYQAELVRPQRYGGSPAATLQRTQAQQELDRLLNGPDRTEIEYNQIDLALANFARAQAELQLDYVELVAPFSGVVTEVNMTVGEIPPPTGAVVMIDDSQFKVNLDIDEIDIMQIQVGQPVNFIVDALPDDSITGIVELVALTPNRGSQVVSYNVRVLLDATSAPIRSGMSTTGQVIVSSIQGTLGVAPQFIYNDSITGTPFVVVVTDTNELQRIPIILGDAGNQLVEITGGITPGQRVVLVASDYIEQIPYRGTPMAKSSEPSADTIREKIAENQQQIRSYAEQRAEGLIDVDLQRTLVKDLQAEIKTLENQLSQAVASPAVQPDNNPTAQAETSDTNTKTSRRKNKKRAKASDSANTPPTEDSTPKQDDTVVMPVSSEPAPTEPANDSKAVSVGNFADDVVVSSAVVTGATDLNSIHEPNVVDIRDITKTYFMGEFDLEVLKGISLQVRQGEFVSIMGPSGSGKSTLMNILGALDQPTAGEYFLDNVDVSKLDEKALAEIRNSKIGFVFQNFNLLKRTTALRQVELPLIYGSHKERSRKAREALESVGLGQRLDHTPAELSGGQQQRVAIARALVTEPSLILADEPTGNLDSRSGTEVMQLFQSLNRNNNITTIFVTHDPWIARHTDRVIMLRDGKIIADQRVKEPLIAGEAERPSEAEELQAIFESTYYGGDEDEYT